MLGPPMRIARRSAKRLIYAASSGSFDNRCRGLPAAARSRFARPVWRTSAVSERHFLGGEGSNVVHFKVGRLRQLRAVVPVGLIEVADLPQLDPMVGDLVQIGRHGLDEIGLPILAQGPPMLAGLAEILRFCDRI